MIVAWSPVPEPQFHAFHLMAAALFGVILGLGISTRSMSVFLRTWLAAIFGLWLGLFAPLPDLLPYHHLLRSGPEFWISSFVLLGVGGVLGIVAIVVATQIENRVIDLLSDSDGARP